MPIHEKKKHKRFSEVKATWKLTVHKTALRLNKHEKNTIHSRARWSQLADFCGALLFTHAAFCC